MDDNSTKWKEILETVFSTDTRTIKIGITGDAADAVEHTDSELTNVALAVMQEFGTDSIPARSFIRASYDEKKDSYFKLLEKLISKYEFDQALGMVGEKIRADMIERINQGIDPPNAAVTIAKKGSSTPLIDTGILKNSLVWAFDD